MTYSRDTSIGMPTKLDEEEVVAQIGQLAELREAVKSRVSKTVSCPIVPIMIPGTSAGAVTANDCLGDQFVILVPFSGVIYSATFWDVDYEKTQVDLELFRGQITFFAHDAAWSPSDIDMLEFVTELAFVSFDDHINSATSELTNIGKAYTAPEGRLWIQAVARSTPDIAIGKAPRIQLQIIPDDPNWQEK